MSNIISLEAVKLSKAANCSYAKAVEEIEYTKIEYTPNRHYYEEDYFQW